MFLSFTQLKKELSKKEKTIQGYEEFVGVLMSDKYKLEKKLQELGVDPKEQEYQET